MAKTETDAEYIARMARNSTLMGEKGRIAWATPALSGLVLVGELSATALGEAVEQGLVRTERVTTPAGNSVLHIIATR
jgi:hypothetical protein